MRGSARFLLSEIHDNCYVKNITRSKNQTPAAITLIFLFKTIISFLLIFASDRQTAFTLTHHNQTVRLLGFLIPKMFLIQYHFNNSYLTLFQVFQRGTVDNDRKES